MPAERFELPTNGLQNRCSTTELSRHRCRAADRVRAGRRLYLPRPSQGSFGIAAVAGWRAGVIRSAAEVLLGREAAGHGCTPIRELSRSASRF